MSDIEEGMRAAGYTRPYAGLICTIFCNSPSPSSYSDANPILLSVRYRVRDHVGAELLLGQWGSGNVRGNSLEEQLSIDYDGTIVAPIVWVGSPRIRAGVGPALLLSRWSHSPRATRKDSHLGLMASAGLTLPIGSWFAIEAVGQYRAFRATTVEPPADGSSAFRSNGVGLGHWYFGVGPALRFAGARH